MNVFPQVIFSSGMAISAFHCVLFPRILARRNSELMVEKIK